MRQIRLMAMFPNTFDNRFFCIIRMSCIIILIGYSTHDEVTELE